MLLAVFSFFWSCIYVIFVVLVALWFICTLTVRCSFLVHPTVFLKACPEAHSDSLAYPLCNRLFIGPKLWLGLETGVCDFSRVLGDAFTILSVFGFC